eukprot:1611881-Rhodomonas_salina.1
MRIAYMHSVCCDLLDVPFPVLTQRMALSAYAHAGTDTAHYDATTYLRHGRGAYPDHDGNARPLFKRDGRSNGMIDFAGMRCSGGEVVGREGGKKEQRAERGERRSTDVQRTFNGRSTDMPELN